MKWFPPFEYLSQAVYTIFHIALHLGGFLKSSWLISQKDVQRAREFGEMFLFSFDNTGFLHGVSALEEISAQEKDKFNTQTKAITQRMAKIVISKVQGKVAILIEKQQQKGTDLFRLKQIWDTKEFWCKWAVAVCSQIWTSFHFALIGFIFS